jgi:hypothetical protein
MADPTLNGSDPTPPARFPFVTVAATVGVLFAFLALIVLAYRSPSFLDRPKPEGADEKAKEEPKPDPAARLAEVKARNEAALNGVGARTSLRAAHAELMGKLKKPTDKLPFPTPPPKADDKGKKP